MSNKFVTAVAAREKVKLMLGLTGPSGSGKTYSALQLAFGITGDWTKITLADTENKSALYYAGEMTGPWNHIDFPPTINRGYHPENWIELLKVAESNKNTEVLILDSITHEWEGVGGSLELVDELSAHGSKFSGGWKTVTPLHRAFIDAMRHSRLHIIATMRSKQDYVVETNDKGKAVPKKVGTKSVQREGTDYEFGIIFDVDMGHYAAASKDRTGLFTKKSPFKISAETGKALLEWANSGREAQVAPVTAAAKVFEGNKEQSDFLVGMLKKWKPPVDETLHEVIAMKLIGKDSSALPGIVKAVLGEYHASK